jgi:hypothetical protein
MNGARISPSERTMIAHPKVSALLAWYKQSKALVLRRPPVGCGWRRWRQGPAKDGSSGSAP